MKTFLVLLSIFLASSCQYQMIETREGAYVLNEHTGKTWKIEGTVSTEVISSEEMIELVRDPTTGKLVPKGGRQLSELTDEELIELLRSSDVDFQYDPKTDKFETVRKKNAP